MNEYIETLHAMKTYYEAMGAWKMVEIITNMILEEK
jgi:hypothetical protein